MTVGSCSRDSLVSPPRSREGYSCSQTPAFLPYIVYSPFSLVPFSSGGTCRSASQGPTSIGLATATGSENYVCDGSAARRLVSPKLICCPLLLRVVLGGIRDSGRDSLPPFVTGAASTNSRIRLGGRGPSPALSLAFRDGSGTDEPPAWRCPVKAPTVPRLLTCLFFTTDSHHPLC